MVRPIYYMFCSKLKKLIIQQITKHINFAKTNICFSLKHITVAPKNTCVTQKEARATTHQKLKNNEIYTLSKNNSLPTILKTNTKLWKR